MSKRMILVLSLSALVGCSTTPTLHENRAVSPLLDGQELFGETIPPAQEVDILDVSREMSEFVSANGRTMSVDWLRWRVRRVSMRVIRSSTCRRSGTPPTDQSC